MLNRNSTTVAVAIYRTIRVIDDELDREYDKNGQIATVFNDRLFKIGHTARQNFIGQR